MAEAYDPHWSVSNPFELTFMTTRCEGKVSPSPSKFADWKFFCPKGKYQIRVVMVQFDIFSGISLYPHNPF